MPPIEYPDDCTSAADALARAKRGHALRIEARKPRQVEPLPQPETIAREVRPYEPSSRPQGFLTKFVAPRHIAAVADATDTVVLDGDPQEEPTTITIVFNVRTVIEKAVKLFNVSWVEMRTIRRGWPLVRYRQIAMYVAYKKTAASMPAIGRAFGGRDHTTVLHAVRIIENFLKIDAEIAAAVDALVKELGAPDDIRRPVAPWLRGKRPASRGDNWTESELAILQRLYIDQGLSAAETAKHLPGRTAPGVMSRASRIIPGEKA